MRISHIYGRMCRLTSEYRKSSRDKSSSMQITLLRQSIAKRSTSNVKKQSLCLVLPCEITRSQLCRYSKSFTIVEPTLFNVCEYWFNKDHDRLRDIRPDSLSQVLNLAGIRPGGRYLAVDDASGIIVAGILDRLGGKCISNKSFPMNLPYCIIQEKAD